MLTLAYITFGAHTDSLRCRGLFNAIAEEIGEKEMASYLKELKDLFGNTAEAAHKGLRWSKL